MQPDSEARGQVGDTAPADPGPRFAGRFGGDEFVVAIPRDAGDAARITDRIRVDVGMPPAAAANI